MNHFYSQAQQDKQKEYSTFFNAIAPFAEGMDKDESIPLSILNTLKESGYLGALVPKEFGGLELDPISFGILNEESGKVCTSVRSLLTVQNMVAAVINRWGNDQTKTNYLSQLASGKQLAAFALTELEHGSDANNMALEISEEESDYVLSGTKKWISFAQIADLFLVFGKLKGKVCCILVPGNSEGIVVKPINGLLGARACMLGEVIFDKVRVPKSNLIGNVGFGLFPVAFTGLDIGRYSIAWGCVGMAQTCLDSTKEYTKSRKQFGETIDNNQLVKQMISDMAVEIKAARLLCYSAGKYMEAGSREAFGEILSAKYLASKALKSAADKAVQLHGANGLTKNYPVERFYRDSKIMHLIEGSDQMLQLMISRYA